MSLPRIGDTAEAKKGLHGFFIGEHIIFKGMEYDERFLAEYYLFENATSKPQQLSVGEFNWIIKRTRTWNELKNEHNCKTTEDLLGLRHAPEFQCPNIKSIVKTATDVHSTSQLPRNWDSGDVDILADKLSSISYDSSDLEDRVNEVWEAVEELRTWGDDWKNLAKHIIIKYNINVEELI